MQLQDRSHARQTVAARSNAPSELPAVPPLHYRACNPHIQTLMTPGPCSQSRHISRQSYTPRTLRGAAGTAGVNCSSPVVAKGAAAARSSLGVSADVPVRSLQESVDPIQHLGDVNAGRVAYPGAVVVGDVGIDRQHRPRSS